MPIEGVLPPDCRRCLTIEPKRVSFHLFAELKVYSQHYDVFYVTELVAYFSAFLFYWTRSLFPVFAELKACSQHCSISLNL